jgi:Zn-dependent alcohol dehydrogenase
MSWKNSRQFAVSSLLPGAGAVLNMMQPAAEQSAVYGVGGVGLAGLMAARIAAAIACFLKGDFIPPAAEIDDPRKKHP